MEVLNAIGVRNASSAASKAKAKEQIRMLRPLQMAHVFLAEVVTSEDTAVDATMGNGHDTFFFWLTWPSKSMLLDIQEQCL